MYEHFCHERWSFQSVAIQAVDWHDDSGPLLSLFFSSSFLCHNLFSYRSAQIKKLVWRKLMGAPRNPLAILGPPRGHCGLSRQCTVAGSAPLQAVSKCPLSHLAGNQKNFIGRQFKPLTILPHTFFMEKS